MRQWILVAVAVIFTGFSFVIAQDSRKPNFNPIVASREPRPTPPPCCTPFSAKVNGRIALPNSAPFENLIDVLDTRQSMELYRANLEEYRKSVEAVKHDISKAEYKSLILAYKNRVLEYQIATNKIIIADLQTQIKLEDK